LKNVGKADPQTKLGINDGLKGLSDSQKHALGEAMVGGPSAIDQALGKVASIFNPKNVYGGGKGSTDQGGVLATAVPFGGQKGAEQILKNTGKDAIDLPAQTFSTLGTIGSDVAGGHLGKAASDIVTPYAQLLAHPAQSFYQHPLDTYLMAAGALHGATRLGAGAVRAVAPESAAGKALSTNREGIQLSGNLTHERPRASPYPLIKAGQKAVDAARYERSPTGALVPKSANLKAKLTGLETSRIIGVNERLRQANRDVAIRQRVQAVAPSVAAKAVHGAKSALKYGPERAAIPGADVLARVADATARRPDTFKADLLKHVGQVAATRPHLQELVDQGIFQKKVLAEHDAYVKALTKAANENHSPADLQRLFKAADAYRADYHPVQTQASEFGHFGNRGEGALQTRELMHYAQTHMDAKFDPVLGMVRSGTKAEVRAFTNGLRTEARNLERRTEKTSGDSARVKELRATIQRSWDDQTVPLRSHEILQHLNGPEGTGGRLPAFTSDRAPRGSAYYVSSERMPLPQNARNTNFAYTHGLTNPGHEALLEQHVRMQGTVDAYKAQRRLISSVAVMKPDGKAWGSFSEAERAAPKGYVPIALSQPFHALDSLDKALEGTDPANIEHEAMAHGLDFNARLKDTGQGRWGLVDQNVLKRVNEHTAQISSNPTMRGFKMTTNQFRQVALGTSPKHVPGVISETAIRSIASAEGISSWITARRLVKRAEQLNPELGHAAHVQLTGGTVSGMTRMMMTKQVSDHFSGTDLHGPLRAFESLMKAPGPRQLRTAWKGWLRLAINGTKKYVEEQSQMSSLGKAALRDFGSEHGPFFKALRLQGQMLDDAAKGLFDPKKQRQLRAEIENVRGRWTDLTPTGQNALMFSPFGLWWVNSVKWLARSPVDRPVQTGVIAGATVGTQKEREAQGLDLFGPNAVPPYMQGGIGLGGGKVLAQNYYSPFGVANDPIQTLGSLVEPALVPFLVGSLGDNYLGKPLNSPKNPHGSKPTNAGQKLEYIANSFLGLFVPLYSKAAQISEGGASAYDSSTPFNPQTKTPGKGIVAGLEKTLRPYRLYTSKPHAQATTGYSIPKTAANASGGQWNVVHSNPAGTGATGTTWKVASP
jgi:hypothetical protein